MIETIGDKIKHIRKKFGVSQEALAKNICTQSEISRIENNKNLPSYHILLGISLKLGVDINYFLNESNLRDDYIKDVKHQLDIARRDRNYELIAEIVRSEEKVPLFSKGVNRTYLLWHKGIVHYHINHDVEAAIKVLSSCLSESNIRNSYTEMDIHILNSMGVIYRNEKIPNKAIIYLGRAHEIVKQSQNLRKNRISLKVLYNLSKVYTDIGKTKTSMELCSEGIKYCHENEDLFLLSEFNYQLGRNYLIDKNIDQGITYWENAKEILVLQGKDNLAKIIQKEIDNYMTKNIVV